MRLHTIPMHVLSAFPIMQEFVEGAQTINELITPWLIFKGLPKTASGFHFASLRVEVASMTKLSEQIAGFCGCIYLHLAMVSQREGGIN